jgi:hypothetical protein
VFLLTVDMRGWLREVVEEDDDDDDEMCGKDWSGVTISRVWCPIHCGRGSTRKRLSL